MTKEVLAAAVLVVKFSTESTQIFTLDDIDKPYKKYYLTEKRLENMIVMN